MATQDTILGAYKLLRKYCAKVHIKLLTYLINITTRMLQNVRVKNNGALERRSS